MIPPLWRIITKFGYFAGLAAVMGSAVVHTAVLRPVLRESADLDVLRRRSAKVMAWSGLVLLVALYPQLAGKAARATDGMSFGTALTPSVVWDHLTVPAPDGQWVSPNFLVLVTYVLFFLSAVLAILLFRSRHVDRIAAITAPLIIVAQLVTAIPGTLDGTSADSWTMLALGYVHPIAACTWVGGIVALVALAGARSKLSESAGFHFPKVVAVEAVVGTAVLIVVPFLNGSTREQAGGEAEPPATGALFAAVFLLLALIVAAFFANRKLHNRIDNPASTRPASASPNWRSQDEHRRRAEGAVRARRGGGVAARR